MSVTVVQDAQLRMSFPVVRPPGAEPLKLRLELGSTTARAQRDWCRDGLGWRSSDGWTVRRAHLVPSSYVRGHENGWAALSPDGVAEWWALDAITAMERAEGWA
jgi:hypothetical protein